MKTPSQSVHEIARGLTNAINSDAEDPRIVLRALLTHLDQEAERAKPEPIICPECTAAGAKSKIVRSHHGGATMDLGPPEPKFYFDDDGREHDHDENQQERRTGYSCNNGHTFTVTRTIPCWCGWTKPTTTWAHPKR
jgi:hypothetical protein